MPLLEEHLKCVRLLAPSFRQRTGSIFSSGQAVCGSSRSIDERSIRQIHQAVAGGLEGGRYRKLDVWLLNRTNRCVCSAPPWRDVPALMKGLGRWLRAATDGELPVIVASIAHLELVAIHPFKDANGRTARALACLILTQGGLAPGSICPETLFRKAGRTAYCEAIEAALGQDYRPGYDATPFVGYVIAALSKALRAAGSRLKPGTPSGGAEVARFRETLGFGFPNRG